MNNQKLLKKYTNSFVTSIQQNIKKGYSVSANIHPARGKGAIIEFEIKENRKSEIEVRPTVATVNKTLSSIKQNMIVGNIEGVTFAGTNLYMEGNRIVIIKGDDDNNSWNNRAAEDDVKKVISPRGSK